MSYTIEQHLDIEAPQFASDTDKAYYIENAKIYYDSDTYGTSYNLIVALQAAHDMTIRDIEYSGVGGSGSITSKSEGGQSISYGNTDYSPGSSAYLQLTRYGKKILYIKRTHIIGLRASGNNENLDDTVCFPTCL